MKGRLSITDVAKTLGITPRTIMRWEKTGKIKKCMRDWRGWRFYTKEDIDEIRRFYESSYDYEDLERSVVTAVKETLAIVLAFAGVLSSLLCMPLYAESDGAAEVPGQSGIQETANAVDINLDKLPVVQNTGMTVMESLKYTLGTNDVIAIDVKRHPEFSGEYTVNSEGKIEYKFVGDILVSGLTKAELKERLIETLGDFLIEPDIDVQIVQYLSKVFYVVGDVSNPGKFYMKGDTITIREALIQAGLPTEAAATRRCRLITPDEKGKNIYSNVNVFSLLYEGNLKQNITMKPGDVLYIPATVMAKIIRIISPVTDTLGRTAGAAASGAATAAIAL